ncbi:type IV toxin-antitoxin system AbiEi family antitoxin domain-containing protein [Kribbella solani]|uniref:type IV toxin-antitoxin system AbiEi family antitoxin domain-containing protein n=1 Tax=Kribbella solani TaxID=236067 RepID=UPI0029B71FBC|nr:type IV toxin-antitoxin system AbiEi family antitoxin domain-containing protein [Kribbella solani]MDX2974677.1 type IV toxin-antitoxin system AbiEi family antitoxin domain-containing protein [Kribbella solani]
MNPRLTLVAERQAGVFSRRQALSSGYTPTQIRARLNDGRWVRIRHGQYAEWADLAAMEPWSRARQEHLRLVHAVVNSRRRGKVAVSHQSALALHGLPLWGLDLGRVHLTRQDVTTSGRIAGVHHHAGELAPADLTQVAGLVTTTAARAAFETACTTSFEAAVVSIDAALHANAVSDEEVYRLLAATEYWPRSATARAAWNFSDARSESVGESRLRVLMANHGLPEPELQVEFHDAHGLVARVDFFFDDFDTVVEFDGKLKYANATAEVLVHEKYREDRLRALGLQVVRSDWTDLSRPDRLLSQLRNAFARAHHAA